jgi:hypothetical protein
MTTETKRYNGWTNYETWNVKLWMDNSQGDYEFWREQTRDCWRGRHRRDSWEVGCSITRTPKQRAVRRLSELLKDQHEEVANDMLENAKQSSSMWADLLGAALSEVDWDEIAESLLEEFEDDEDETDEDEETV